MKLEQVIPHRADIRTYMPGTTIPASCLVGIEVELEQYTGPDNRLKYWLEEDDGSLRGGGVEFVLAQPLTGHDLELAINELYDKVLTKAEYQTNHRCSTHIHLDVRNLSVQHLQKIAFVYSMFEQYIYSIVDTCRERNFYCTPLYASLQNRRSIVKSFDILRFGRCPKYSGLNLRTVEKYGSLEFRMHEGLTDNKDIRQWVQFLMLLRSGTAKYEDVPMDRLLNMYSQDSAEAILKDVLGEEFFASMVPVTNDSTKRGMRAAQDFLLLKDSGSIKTKEMQWRHLDTGDGIDGIPADVLEQLRGRREELLN